MARRGRAVFDTAAKKREFLDKFPLIMMLSDTAKEKILGLNFNKIMQEITI